MLKKGGGYKRCLQYIDLANVKNIHSQDMLEDEYQYVAILLI